MPIEVNELSIFMRIREKDAQKEEAKGDQPGEDCCGSFSKEEIVAECVDIIIELLNRKNHR